MVPARPPAGGCTCIDEQHEWAEARESPQALEWVESGKGLCLPFIPRLPVLLLLQSSGPHWSLWRHDSLDTGQVSLGGPSSQANGLDREPQKDRGLPELGSRAIAALV